MEKSRIERGDKVARGKKIISQLNEIEKIGAKKEKRDTKRRISGSQSRNQEKMRLSNRERLETRQSSSRDNIFFGKTCFTPKKAIITRLSKLL